MLIETFNMLYDSLEDRSPASLRVLAVILAAIGAVLVVVGSLIPLGPVAVTLGCAAGVLWVGALQIAWWFLIPESWRQATDWRGNWALGKRRVTASWIAVLWLGVLAFAGAQVGSISYVTLGALNVTVLITLAHIAFASDEERAEWSEEQEAILQRKQYQKAVKKGLIDPDEDFEEAWEDRWVNGVEPETDQEPDDDRTADWR